MTTIPWGLEFKASTDVPDVSVTIAYDAAGGVLSVLLRNTGGATARPRSVSLDSALALPTAGGHAWLHGRYMQMDALVRVFGDPHPDGYSGHWLVDGDGGRELVSHEQLALTLPVKASPVLFAGSLDMRSCFTTFRLAVDSEEASLSRLSIVFDVDGIDVAPGAEFALPQLVLREGRDAQQLIEAYAGEVGEAMGARVPPTPPTGWCSWYDFYDRVGEDDIARTVEALRDGGYSIEVVQVDDGFQSRTGDWLTPNDRFPSGMKAVADGSRSAGFRPGLWLAPFVLHEDSAALRDYPEIALRSAEGEVVFVDTWLGRCAVLDCTHPASEAWLSGVIQTVVREWGFTYLKVDALAYAAQRASRVAYYHPGTTAAVNLRRGLEIIRRAAGDDTFLLGCTCHFGPAIGLVDAMRVGPDVKACWEDGPNPSVRHAMRMTLQRGWMHGRWWANDPDCLVVRDTGSDLSEAETRFLATGIALSGGSLFLGDDLARVSPGRAVLARTLLPPTGMAAEAMDAASGPAPSAWRARIDAERSLAGFLNWDDSPRWLSRDNYLAPGEIAFDPWAARLVGMGDVLLAPHEGVLWQVTAPGPTPRVVGDSASLVYAGLFQRQVSGRIQVRNDLDQPRTIAVEFRGRVVEVDLEPGEMRWFD